MTKKLREPSSFERALANRIAEILVGRLLSGAPIVAQNGSGGDEERGEEDDAEKASQPRQGKKKRRAKQPVGTGGNKKPNTKALRDLLALLRAKGPLRVAQLEEITGMVQSTLNRLLNILMAENKVRRLKENKHVLFASVRGGPMARKTNPKPSTPAPSLPTPVSE